MLSTHSQLNVAFDSQSFLKDFFEIQEWKKYQYMAF